ncbi:MAG: TolC family protein [Puniceicoccaceae bacterium]
MKYLFVRLVRVFLFSAIWVISVEAQSGNNAIYPNTENLTLQDYMQRVVDYNQAVQSKLLGFHAARRQRRAELGSFEPTLVTRGNFADRRWPQTGIEERSQGWTQEAFNRALDQDPDNDPPPLDLYPYIGEERTRRYSSDIEIMTPVGTRVRVGAKADDILRNHASSPAYDTSQSGYTTAIGFSIEQPILRGMGFTANLASLRLAARQSEIAFQEYRRELMRVVSAAEMAYWDLFYAQQEYALSEESVALAETLLKDSQASHEAGRGAMLDVLEAEAGLAVRKSRQSDARLKCIEAMNEMASFFGGVPRRSSTGLVAVDSPESKPVEHTFSKGVELALNMNPDLQRARLETEQARVRFGFARNQRLPELNMTAGVDLVGNGLDWTRANEDIEELRFPAWSVGVVFRVPIWGDVRKRNELWAAKLKFLEAERMESNLVNQLTVGRHTSEQRVDSNYTTARSLERVVEFRTNLLETRMQSRDVGRMDARSVLEAEQELFAARLEQLKSEVECQRAMLDLQLISGNLLQMRNIEISFADLEYRSADWAKNYEEKTPSMVYMVADPARLSMSEAQDLGGDSVSTPWLGFDWGKKKPSEK